MKLLMCAISGRFEMWQYCVAQNAKLADAWVFRFDGRHLSVETIERDYVPHLPDGSKWFVSSIEPDKANWREELLQFVHHLPVAPNYILFPDEDEVMPDVNYEALPPGQYMFGYTMPTCDGRKALTYPALPHAKAFEYREGLSYEPYFHQARVGLGGFKLPEIKTGLQIQHYCFYRPEWEEHKMRSIVERYPDYFVRFPK